MKRAMIALVLTLGLASSALADTDEEARLDIAGDVFRAGQQAVHESGTAEDLFLAGETVRASAPVTENAHTAGRWVTISNEIGGDLYAAGMTVKIEAPVSGDVSVAGYEVSLSDVGGDLRATGSTVELGGPVAGYALLTAETLQFGAPVAGDTHIMAREVEFGEDARVDGKLVIYEATPGTLEVPESVAPADRIERRDLEAWDKGIAEYRPPGWGGIIARFLMGLIIVAGLAALAAALVPQTLASIRERLLDQPLRSLWFGFLGQSVLVGATVILAMSILGLLLSPTTVVLALLVGFAGYVAGTYAFGVGILQAAGRPLPAEWTDKAIAAALGAVAAGVLGLVPFLGWLFVLALTLAGVGAITLHFFRPRFFV